MKKLVKRFVCILLITVICMTSMPVNSVYAANSAQIPDDAIRFNGHYYKAYNDSKSWQSAKSYCESLGGHLATITSQAEQGFIVNTFLTGNPKKKCYFLGGYRNSISSKIWYWITGETFDYSNWAGGEDSQSNEPGQIYTIVASGNSTWMTPYKWFSHMNYDTGTSIADWAGKYTGFICEWETNEQMVIGTVESYVHTVVFDDGASKGDYYVSKMRIDGKYYEVEKGLIDTNAEAESYENKFVIAYLNEDGKIYDIKIDKRKRVNEENWYQSETNGEKNYGAQQKQSTMASQVLAAANDFENAMQDYLNLLGSEAGSVNTELVDVNGMVSDLKSGKQALFDLPANAPAQAKESAYYAVAKFIIDVVNDKQIYLKLNPNDTENKQSKTLLNSLANCMENTTKTYYHGDYAVTLNVFFMGSAFTGSISVKKSKGSDKGKVYMGPIVTDEKRTMDVMSAYVNNLNEIVKDQCKYALAEIKSEFKSVTGIASWTESSLETYFESKVDALLKGKYGNVLNMFININRGYNAIKKFKDFCRRYNQEAKSWLSTNDFRNALEMFSELENLNVDYSLNGNEKACVKEAVNKVKQAKKKLEDTLFEYIYGVDSENNKEKEKTDIGDWFCSIIQCPVEFEVYDSQGNLLGYVDSSERHSEYIDYSEEIFIEVENDVKYVYYPSDMEVLIKFTAIDNGEMNYSIEKLENGVPTGKINYFDVPLTLDEQFEQTIPANADLTETAETLFFEHSDTVVKGDYISAEEDEYINVNCLADDQGFAIGGGEYPIGSSVKMMAFADEACVFHGWYVDGCLVSTDIVYQFTATENVEIIALFEAEHGDGHNFVDGSCTGCIEKAEPLSSIQNITYVQQEDTHKTFTVTVNGRQSMIQFIEPDGGTRTYDRYNKNVSIKSYNANGEEINSLSRDLAYEVWEIYTNLSVGKTVLVRAKLNGIWESDKRSLFVEPYNPVVTMELSSTSGKKGPVPAMVVADDKTEKVMFKMPDNTTVTVTSKATDENGNKIFTGKAWMNKEGLNEIRILVYRRNVWRQVGTLEYVAE